VRLTTSPPSYAECHEIWEPKPPETLWTTPGLLRDCFTFNFTFYYVHFMLSLENLPPQTHAVFAGVCEHGRTNPLLCWFVMNHESRATSADNL